MSLNKVLEEYVQLADLRITHLEEEVDANSYNTHAMIDLKFWKQRKFKVEKMLTTIQKTAVKP